MDQLTAFHKIIKQIVEIAPAFGEFSIEEFCFNEVTYEDYKFYLLRAKIVAEKQVFICGTILLDDNSVIVLEGSIINNKYYADGIVLEEKTLIFIDFEAALSDANKDYVVLGGEISHININIIGKITLHESSFK